jgi:hypothetical protein
MVLAHCKKRRCSMMDLMAGVEQFFRLSSLGRGMIDRRRTSKSAPPRDASTAF